MTHPKIGISEKIEGHMNLKHPAVLLSDLGTCMELFVNWHEVIRYKAGMGEGITLVFKDGTRVRFKDRREYNENFGRIIIAHNLNKDYSHLIFRTTPTVVDFGDAAFNYSSEPERLELMGRYGEIFSEEPYLWLPVQDRIVVDVGANIGDTAIYFAMRGARRVYALEPYPYAFGIMRRNIALNRMKRKIVPLNIGIGARESSMKVDPGYKSNAIDELGSRNFKSGKEVEILSFYGLLERYKINDAVLKIDCEGGEYDSLLGATQYTLRRFSAMQIEYHYGYKSLERHLKACGFSVEHTRPLHCVNAKAQDPHTYAGYIYAERLGSGV